MNTTQPAKRRFFISLSVIPRWMVKLLVLGVCFVSVGLGFAGAQAGEPTAPNVRVAEGEYKVLTENGIGPFDPAVYGFSEEWTLWRVADGSFQVTGIRSYRSPSYESHMNRFAVQLSSDLNVLQLKEFRKLLFRRDSSPLTCDFFPDRITCSSNAKDTTQNLSLNLPLHAPFGIIWPPSAFTLGAITHLAPRDPKIKRLVDLLTFEEVSFANPVSPMILSGQLKYLGKEDLLLAERNWVADKFELKMPFHAPFLLWVSARGLLLAFAPETHDKALSGGMVLTRYEEFEDF